MLRSIIFAIACLFCLSNSAVAGDADNRVEYRHKLYPVSLIVPSEISDVEATSSGFRLSTTWNNEQFTMTFSIDGPVLDGDLLLSSSHSYQTVDGANASEPLGYTVSLVQTDPLHNKIGALQTDIPWGKTHLHVLITHDFRSDTAYPTEAAWSLLEAVTCR